MNNRRRHASVECLEDRQLLSLLLQEQENNNRPSRANGFAFDADGVVTLQGTSANRNDQDFFAFTAPSSGSLGIAVRSGNGVFAQLEVETANGVDVLETQPRNGRNTGTLTVMAGESYRIRLRSPINARAVYTAELALGGAPPVDGSDPVPSPSAVVRDTRRDDSIGRANAVQLTAGAAVQLRGTVTRRDRDYFVFTAPADGTLSIGSRTLNGVLAKVEVQDSTGAKLFETEPNDGVTTGNISLVAGRTYVLRVRSAVNNTASIYAVDVLFGRISSPGGGGGETGGGSGSPSGSFAEAEPNDSKGAASAISLGLTGSAQLQGTSTNQDDRDYFVFNASQSGALTARVATGNGTFAQLEVEDSQGRTILETEPNDGVNVASGAIVAGRSYFIRLRSPIDAPAAYLVDLFFGEGGSTGGDGDPGGGDTGGGGGVAGGSVAEAESNDEKPAANRFDLAVGSPARLAGTSTSRDDRDFFVFTAAASGTLSVTLSTAAGPLADLEIEDAASVKLLELEDGRTTGSVDSTLR